MKTLIVSLSAALALGVAAPSMAQDAAPATAPEIKAEAEAEAAVAAESPIIRETDGAMTCPQMSEEAAHLSQTMGGEPKGGLFSILGGVARAGAAMVIPGAGLVIAGADAVNRPAQERKEADARAVESRWYYLNGLYAGKGCQAQAEAADAAAAVPPVAPAAPAVPVN